MSTETIVKCDLCGMEGAEAVNLPVCFTTDQTEGRSREPYISLETLDVCEKCLERITVEQPIWANGAQGNNAYFWKNNESFDNPERQDK